MKHHQSELPSPALPPTIGMLRKSTKWATLALLPSMLAGAALGQTQPINQIYNSGFELGPTRANSNLFMNANTGNAIGWIDGGGQQPNIVQVDGPGGFDYSSQGVALGPENDATGTATATKPRRYLDITNGGGKVFQRFIPQCDGTVRFGAWFSTRENTGGKGELQLVQGNDPNGINVATSLPVLLPGGVSKTDAWKESKGTATLVAGTTYCFVVSMDNQLNMDEAYVFFPQCAKVPKLPDVSNPTWPGTNPTGPRVDPTEKVTMAPQLPLNALVLQEQTLPGACCPGANLLENGGMDGSSVTSDYKPSKPGGPVLPGQYTLTKTENLPKICPNWRLPEACSKTEDFSGSVLVVNGLTNQFAAANSSVIFTNTIKLPSSGEKEKTYRICFRYLPLPACCFNVTAKPSLLFNVDGKQLPPSDVSDMPVGCGNLYSATFVTKATSATVSILLPGNAAGDGNDLLIDNLFVHELAKIPLKNLLFSTAANPANGSVVLTANPALPTPEYNNVWEIYDGATLISTVVNPTTATFTGLAADKTYTIKRKAWSPCHVLSGTKQDWSYGNSALRSTNPVEDPKPEAVKATAKDVK